MTKLQIILCECSYCMYVSICHCILFASVQRQFSSKRIQVFHIRVFLYVMWAAGAFF